MLYAEQWRTLLHPLSRGFSPSPGLFREKYIISCKGDSAVLLNGHLMHFLPFSLLRRVISLMATHQR
jgi:hypothetical protein